MMTVKELVNLPAELHTHLEEWRDHLGEWRTHLAEWRKQIVSAAPTAQVVDSAVGIDAIRKMIHNALKASGLTGKSSGFTCTATLTLKVQKSDDPNVGVKFSVCGVRGGASAARKSASTQTLTIKFRPTEASTDTLDAGGINPGSIDQFTKAFNGLTSTLDTGDPFGTKEAVIDIDFALDDAANVSIIAGDNVKDDSTHHLQVRLVR
jgi:hypothetical protein